MGVVWLMTVFLLECEAVCSLNRVWTLVLITLVRWLGDLVPISMASYIHSPSLYVLDYLELVCIEGACTFIQSYVCSHQARVQTKNWFSDFIGSVLQQCNAVWAGVPMKVHGIHYGRGCKRHIQFEWEFVVVIIHENLKDNKCYGATF